MTNQRDPNKVSIGAYITREEKEKLDQLRYEMGNISVTDFLRQVINEKEEYGKYKPPIVLPKSNPEYKYPKSESENE